MIYVDDMPGNVSCVHGKSPLRRSHHTQIEHENYSTRCKIIVVQMMYAAYETQDIVNLLLNLLINLAIL